MSLGPDEVAKIARLARLNIASDEIDDVAATLSRIIGFVEQLGTADTGDAQPMAHPLDGLVQRLRADVVDEHDQRELFARNAPAVEAGLYLVPRVIE